MFWASAPKRCKGKNIFGFDSTFCGDCLGYGQTDFIKQVLDDILEHVGFNKAVLADLAALFGSKKGLKRCLTVSSALFGNEKGLKCRWTLLMRASDEDEVIKGHLTAEKSNGRFW